MLRKSKYFDSLLPRQTALHYLFLILLPINHFLFLFPHAIDFVWYRHSRTRLVFQVQIMLIDAQFFPLHTQEHRCKKESWCPKKYFPVSFPKLPLRPHYPFWIPKCGMVMVALVLLAWSLHIRRIYLRGGVKQYEQTMKSQVVKCVKFPIYYYFLWCCFQPFFTACNYNWWIWSTECLSSLLFISKCEQQQAVKSLLYPNSISASRHGAAGRAHSLGTWSA